MRDRVRWSAPVSALCAFVVGATAGGAQEAPAPQLPAGDDKTPYSEIELVSAVTSVQPGVPFTLAVHITVDPGWHTYWVNGGDAGDELLVDWALPAGFAAGPFQWPVPKLLPAPPLMSYGYEGQVFVLVEITPSVEAPPGSTVEIRGAADFQVCADICLIALDEIAVTLPVRAGASEPDANWAATIDDIRERLPRPAGDWEVRAWTNGTEDEGAAYVLEIAPTGRGTDPAPASLSAPHLFADSGFVIEHASPQRVARVGDAIRIEIPRNYYETVYGGRLGGVLVADVASESTIAWEVQAAVQDAPADVSGQAADPLRGPDVVETGGVPEGMAPLGRPADVLATAGSTAGLGMAAALLFALLGGVILNLMPCVFPVLSMKVLGLVDKGGEDPHRVRAHGLLFGAGVLATLWALAGVLVALRAGGLRLGWGFQLQSPVFVGLLALLVFGLGLNLSGLFEIGVGMTRLGGGGARDTYRDSFLMGGLTVLVATPCTAPFMGAALGFALSQPAAVGLAVFTALGVGLAAPYVLLSSMPALLTRLPRPGAWMETLKQALAFPMFATAVWLVWVFGNQAGVDSTALLLLSLTLLSLAGWIYGRFGWRGAPKRAGFAALVVGLTSVMTLVQGARIAEPTQAASSRGSDVGWEPYSSERLLSLRSEGRPIFVDFTADWCLSCKVNDRIALNTDAVRTAFAEANVALLVADWTNRDPVIAAAIESYGRSGIPLYVLYSGDPALEPEILPAVLTQGTVIEAVRRMTASE